jgi:N-acetylglucosaminyldiphosphoundecaprenol N-acetyl-beta-D-mannosaminyltransferase
MSSDARVPTARPWRRVELLGLPVDDLTMDETLAVIDTLIAEGGVHQHVVINVAKAVQADRDPALAAIIRECDIVNVDGQPIVWASKLLGTPLRERVAGVDLMVRLIARAAERGYRVYLLGAREPVVRAVAERITRDHPAMILAGWRDGYWTPAEEPQVVAGIAATRPDILFVAISSPFKERFLARWKDEIGASFVMGVGGSFDVHAGLVKRAPGWMQRSGLEWFYRVLQEPGRMWRRYAGDAPKFALLVLRHWRRRGTLTR